MAPVCPGRGGELRTAGLRLGIRGNMTCPVWSLGKEKLQTMTDQKQLEEDRRAAAERRKLAEERIFQIADEHSVREPYREFFRRTADFLLMCADAADRTLSGELDSAPLEELSALNHALYADILPENYPESWGNPVYAAGKAGEAGRYLSAVYAEIRTAVYAAFEGRTLDLAILEELFLELYSFFETAGKESGETDIQKGVRDILYYHMFDYADRMIPDRNRESLDPEADFGKKLVMESDLADPRYLYRFGEYISPTELRTAEYMAGLPEETVRKMADTFTGGYLDGFRVSGRTWEKKKTVQFRWHLGFERMMRIAVENFRREGLEAVLPRRIHGAMNQARSRETGYYATSPNRQYDYDHRYDMAAWYDKAMKERKLEVLRTSYADLEELAAGYAGPAVLEVFGEPAFHPENRKEAFSLTEKQEKLILAYTSETMQLVNRYIPGDETTFTIIAFPLPDIGEKYEEIFRETIRVNTLDNDRYRKIQQKMIDVLDTAEYAEIHGKDGNRTNLRIALCPLMDRSRESRFENCVADVNIPLGEIFTSPKLEGTEGLLHVQNVFIDGYHFRDLEIRFANGRTVSATCRNFDREEENRKLVRQVILRDHETLPMGEFAIGTNTSAYAMGIRYGIQAQLPILIAEKTGPHFAVGDTCYSWSEDVAVFNPDGREMVAKENEISRLRTTDPGKAYFGCHTDITIPYSELDTVLAVRADGEKTALIRGGRFVLPGTEELNEPLQDLSGEKTEEK